MVSMASSMVPRLRIDRELSAIVAEDVSRRNVAEVNDYDLKAVVTYSI